MRPSSDLRPSDPRVEGTKQGGERTKQVGVGPNRKNKEWWMRRVITFVGDCLLQLLRYGKLIFLV